MKSLRDSKRDPFIVRLLNLFQGGAQWKLLKRYDEDERYDMVLRCLKKLGHECQDIIYMLYTENMSFKEIGVEIGTSDNHARQKKFQCLYKLKTCVGK